METHSSLRYCPSCGMISECLISRWGASVRRRYELQELSEYWVFEPVYNNSLCSSTWADLSFSSCPSSAVLLITHLQTNPTLILSKCKATPLGINMLLNLLFLLSASLTPNSALHILHEMAALTVDLQDLCCQVGVGQRLVLHATGVSNTIIPSVHLKLQGASDCERFSCWVHVCSTCKEPRSQRESKWGSNVLVKRLLMMKQIYQFYYIFN